MKILTTFYNKNYKNKKSSSSVNLLCRILHIFSLKFQLFHYTVQYVYQSPIFQESELAWFTPFYSGLEYIVWRRNISLPSNLSVLIISVLYCFHCGKQNIKGAKRGINYGSKRYILALVWVLNDRQFSRTNESMVKLCLCVVKRGWEVHQCCIV